MSAARSFRNAALKPKGEQSIITRRIRENYLESNNQVVLGYKNLNSKVEWAEKHHVDGQKTMIRNVQKSLNNCHEADLNSRREKLAELYNQEMNQWKLECLNNVETPEDRKADMMRRARELKERREEERQAFVEKKRLQQHREACDDVRALDSKKILQTVLQDREKQIVEKKQAILEEKHYEATASDLWEKDRLKKEQKEIEEKEKLKRQNEEVKQILNLQVTLYQEKLKRDKKLEEYEEQHLLELWQRKNEMEQENKRRQRQESIERAEQIKQFNKEREYIQQQKIQKEQEYDMELLRIALEKEAEANEKEKAAQEKFQREQAKHKEDIKRQMEKQEDDNAHLNILRNKMENEVWDKRDAQHALEAAARQRLLNDVLETRELQRKEKEKLSQLEKQQEMKFAKYSEKQVEEKLEQETAEERHKRLLEKAHQQNLLEQIAFKTKQQEREKQDDYLVSKQSQYAEKQREKMVQKIFKEKPVVDYKRKTSQWYFNS